MKRATERCVFLQDYTKTVRLPGNRHRTEVSIAVENRGDIRFDSNLGWKDYGLALPPHDPADDAHFVKMFRRFKSESRAYKVSRKIESTRARGKALCHKAQWIKDRKDFDGDECLLFPCMIPHRPERVKYNFRDMPAARAALIMTQGLPPDEKLFAVHTCGNGHLSCVNPKHIKWGTAKDNAKDAVLHNTPSEFIAGMDQDMVRAIKASPQMVKVIAERTGIPAAVVSAIKLGDQFAGI